MRLISILMTTCVLALAFPPSSDPLTGRWRGLELTSTGVGEVFEFKGGKDLDFGPATIMDGSYRMVGTDIVLKSSKNAPESKLDLEWDGRDQIRIEDEPANQTIKLIRVGKIQDTGNPLLGEWMTPQDVDSKNLPSHSFFYADGRNVWVIPQSIQHAHYSIEGQTIRIEIPNRPVIEGSFTLDGNHLKLPNAKGGQSNFERF
jgi:hypothetical protein